MFLKIEAINGDFYLNVDAIRSIRIDFPTIRIRTIDGNYVDLPCDTREEAEERLERLREAIEEQHFIAEIPHYVVKEGALVKEREDT